MKACSNYKKVDIPKTRLKKMRLFKETPHEVILHCSDSDVVSYNAEAINKDHIARGWLAIGYHFVIEKERIMIGRPLDYMGSHCLGKNHSTIGICVMGKYIFSQKQANMLAKLLQNLGFIEDHPHYKKGQFYQYVMLDRISPHHRYSDEKTCPNFMVEYFLQNRMLRQFIGFKNNPKWAK